MNILSNRITTDVFSTRRIHRAFTLIELLVVIAIISILAALLQPVFSGAKNQASQARGPKADHGPGWWFANGPVAGKPFSWYAGES